MNDAVVAVLMLIGASFLLLAAIGVVRMPDLYSRMQAATKAATLGVGFMLVSVATHFQDSAVIIRALLVTAFFLLTAPVAAHLIGRAAYFVGVPLWEGTIVDELCDKYDRESHLLQSVGCEPEKSPAADS